MTQDLMRTLAARIVAGVYVANCVIMALWHQVAILWMIFAASNSQLNEKVILHPVENVTDCPGDIITLQCSVQSTLLEWKCADGTYRLVHCSSTDIQPLRCQTQVFNVTLRDCDTSSGNAITSFAKFTVPNYTITLTCGDALNMSINETRTIPTQPQPPQKLYLNDKIKRTDDANLRVATLHWDELATGRQKTYNVTIEPALQGCNSSCVTEHPYVELKLAIETLYNVTIITTVCNGSLQSIENEPFQILLNVPSPVMSCNVTLINEGDVKHTVQWSSLKNCLNLYYVLMYSLNGNISRQVIQPLNCNHTCSYNITEDSASNVSVMGINNVGSGERTLCNDFPSSNGANESKLYKVFISIAILVVVLAIILSTPLPKLCVQEKGGKDGMAALEKSTHKSGKPFKEMEAGRSVVHKSNIYFAPYNSEEIVWYSVDNDEWKILGGKMLYCNPGLAIIDECDGYIAAIGGQKGDQPTNEVWVWKDARWVSYPSMAHKRSDPAVVTSSDYNYIIAISGNMRSDVVVPWTPSVEVYDVREPSWKSVCPLPSPHTGVEVTLCNGYVYAFPDQYRRGFKCSMSALVSSTADGQCDVWESIRNSPLRFSTPATIDDCVMCVGGANEKKCGLDEIHVYDDVTNSWDKIEGYLKVGRMYSMVEVCNRTVVVVGGIPELTEDRHISKRLNTVDIFHLTDTDI